MGVMDLRLGGIYEYNQATRNHLPSHCETIGIVQSKYNQSNHFKPGKIILKVNEI